jgi:gamma-glutamyl:cysteine ligase YbdK (ATP-grasp superfamily)
MKFGLESEKIIYDVKNKQITNKAYRIIDALSDYKVPYGDDPVERVKPEFVLNMIELISNPSESLLDVARDYLFSYEIVRDAASRHHVVLLPIASFPLAFDPVMVTKWSYLVKNSILSKNYDPGWDLKPEHALFNAANCSGVHIHCEIFTPSELVPFNHELMSKHNLASALTPLISLSSSPYFNGEHEAKSMRVKKYFMDLYGNTPLQGGMPEIYSSSLETVKHYYDSYTDWLRLAKEVGHDVDAVAKMIKETGADWGMIRWNRKWNTVEMRCLDNDFVDMNIGKFVAAAGALRCLSKLPNEDIQVLPLPKSHSVTEMREKVKRTFELNGNTIWVLATEDLHEVLKQATYQGLESDLVYDYMKKLTLFSLQNLKPEEKWLLIPVIESIKNRTSTSDWILQKMGKVKKLNRDTWDRFFEEMIHEENNRFQIVVSKLPTHLQPPTDHPFPQGDLF